MPFPQRQKKPGKGPDPVQKALRVKKKRWSKEVSHFTHALTELKSGLNGRGSTDLNITPSRIQDPLPQEVGSTLSQLAAQFQNLVGGANSIISDQASYSQTRQKKQPKRPKEAPQQETPIQQPPAQDQVVQQLSQLAFEQYLIKKEATNRLTRSLQYLKSLLPFREKFNRERVNLLSSTASLFYAVLDLENDALVLGVSNIPTAVAKYRVVKYHIETFGEALGQTVQMLSVHKKQEGDGSSGNDEGSDEDDQEIIRQLEGKLSRIFNRFKSSRELTNLNETIDKFKREEDPIIKSELKMSITRQRDALFEKLKKEKGADLVNEVINRNANSELETLTKFAHNPITRFLRRQLVKTLKVNKTSLPRLKIVEHLDTIKTSLRVMMNSLENSGGIDSKVLLDEFNKILTEFEQTKSPLHILTTMYREKFYNEQRKKTDRSDDQLQDWLLTRKLRQEMRQDLF